MLVASYSELAIYSVAGAAALAGMCQVPKHLLLYLSSTVQMRQLSYDKSHRLELDLLLLLVAQASIVQ